MNLLSSSLSLLGFGTFPLQGDVLLECLNTAENCGYTLFDTAFKYRNEKSIGKYIRKSAKNILIESKLSITQLVRKKFMGITFMVVTPEKALRKTLSQLGLSCIDIYLLHSPNRCVELYGELMALRAKGLVKMIGGCRMEIQHLEDIYKRYGEYPEINQIEMHPYCSNLEIVEFCKEKGIVVQGRSPFAHGDLLYEFQTNPTLLQIAKRHSKTVPQVIIRWIIQKGAIAISRSSNPEHIKENSQVFDFMLNEDEITMIDSLNKNQSMGCLSINKANI